MCPMERYRISVVNIEFFIGLLRNIDYDFCEWHQVELGLLEFIVTASVKE